MKKNKQPDGMPVWFDGKSINEALFCEEFLHAPLYSRGSSPRLIMSIQLMRM